MMRLKEGEVKIFTTKSMMVVLVVSLLLVASSAQANLFSAFGDMETGGSATTPPTGWENTVPVGHPSSVVGVSSDTMDGSSQSLILTGGTDGSYDYAARANYAIEGTYEGDYTLSYDWKGDIYTSFWADSVKKQADWQRTTDWATFSKIITIPAGTERLAMTFYDNSGGPDNTMNPAWFDNLSFVGDGPVGPDCDFDSSGGCGLSDINLMMTQGDLVVGVSVSSGNQFDLSGNGIINQADIRQWLTLTGTANGFSSPVLRGDTDGLDNVSPAARSVDITDFQNFLGGFTGAGSTWEVGNFDGNGVVDITDFSNYFLPNFAATGGGTYGPGQSIPEPSTVVLLGLGGALLAYIFGRDSLTM